MASWFSMTRRLTNRIRRAMRRRWPNRSLNLSRWPVSPIRLDDYDPDVHYLAKSRLRGHRYLRGHRQMKVAFLFPGQGAQRVGMGAELAREFAAAREAFDEADAALGFRLSTLCFEGPEEDLRLTANTQPATLATSIAALRTFEAEYGVKAEIAAGHSLGEYTALVAAGALDFAAALRAVRERGRKMQEACPPGQGSMAALVGLDLTAVREVCELASQDDQIAVPANLNAPSQIVIAGNAGAVRRAIEIAKERGASMSVELKVSAPFHSPLMQPARVGMEPVIAALEVNA